MYLKKTEKYILDYLKSNYKNNDLKEIQKGGMLVQKSPEGIDSDFGTSIPLRLAKIIRKNPMDIAQSYYVEGKYSAAQDICLNEFYSGADHQDKILYFIFVLKLRSNK